MAFYEREYLSNGSAAQAESHYSHEQSARGSLVAFLKQTYQIFAGSLLAATVGAYIGLGMAESIASWYWGLVILEFALLFGLYAVKNKPGINFAVLFGFTFVSGLTITPLLSAVLGMPGGASIVSQAFLMTAVIFGTMSMFALTTTKDFTSYSKPLFIALIVIVVASVINIFLGNPLLQTIIAGVGALLFSFFIIFDTQNIVKGAFATPIEAAVALYLDFLNLFVSLLQLLGIFNNDE